MARLSKSKAFATYEDTVEQDVEDSIPEHEELAVLENNHPGAKDNEEDETTSVVQHGALELELRRASRERDGEDADDERRESTVSSTTVSSFPDSYYMTEHEDGTQAYQTYTPPIIRPRFRRPESVKRMQLASPPPYGYRSPRQSILSHARSRTGTPRSVRPGNVRGSPRARNRASEEDSEQKHYPLVLLHVSLLPLDAPWSLESMRELLAPETSENVQLLRSKLSDTVLQRGLLILHPREEYELLEERLLEALELKDERLTKCGHFHGRASGSSEESGRQSDSGVGSSTDSSDEELCAICRKHILQSKSGVKAKDKKWMIKVYAANGLMRSSAWAAAWPDMERVDVEIMPWIDDETRRKLDEVKVKEDAEAQDRLEDQEARIREIVDQQVRIAIEERMSAYATLAQGRTMATMRPIEPIIPESRMLEAPSTNRNATIDERLEESDLPQIYQPSQIPISVLIKNYVYLLLQDRRNIAVLGLSIVVLAATIVLNPLFNNSRMASAGQPVEKGGSISHMSASLIIPSPEPTAVHLARTNSQDDNALPTQTLSQTVREETETNVEADFPYGNAYENYEVESSASQSISEI